MRKFLDHIEVHGILVRLLHDFCNLLIKLMN
jgi:hypothetical protein